MTSQPGFQPLSAAGPKVIEAFRKYARETEDSTREIATKIGVPVKTLQTWLEGQAQPTKRLMVRLAGFLRREGYI